MTKSVLRLILGDQLNINHSWFGNVDQDVIYAMMEVRQETDYVKHHIQKVLAFFASMRAFAKQLQQQGHTIHYLRLDDPENRQSIPDNLTYFINKYNVKQLEYQLPDEYRLDQQLNAFCDELSIKTKAMDTEHFLSMRHDVKNYFSGKNQFLMESFYRHMRDKHNILMEDKKPIGGKWNYDIKNRRKYDGQQTVPEPLIFDNKVEHLITLLEAQKVKTFGHCEYHLIWPINRAQSLELLNYFIKHALPYFGSYQDAMVKKHWSLFHSRLSFSLNTKMLHPMEVIISALNAWNDNRNQIELHQIEGFVRQILGWREYMRGIYWSEMPDYKNLNFFDHHRKLPHYYWDAETNMQCMKYALDQSLKKAYAHHIQRLMITGNFALLAGIHPDEVDAWYLGVYIDAVEWVEMTNTRGMSQYADGGIVGSKPYISTANYIQKMSDYCEGCFYDYRKKYGDKACPFNSLYWAFYHRHRKRLGKNPRVAMMYRVWDLKSETERYAILEQADLYLQNVEKL